MFPGAIQTPTSTTLATQRKQGHMVLFPSEYIPFLVSDAVVLECGKHVFLV